MNLKPIVSVQLAAAFLLLCQDGSQSQTLYVDHLSPQRSVRVDPTSAQPANAMLEGRYAVEVSTDLHHWEPLVDFPAFDWFRFAAPVAADRAGPQQFYRLSETPTPVYTTGRADEMFGYASALQKVMSGLHLSAPESLLEFQPFTVTDTVDWEPSEAEYFDRFNADINDYNANRTEEEAGRHYDFRINEKERFLFDHQGMVVSERLSQSFFTEIYYRLWSDHLPVYFTADSVLQPWQYSFRTTLKEAESDFLTYHTQALLKGLFELASDPIIQRRLENSEPLIAEAFEDLQIWIAVGRSLIEGQQYEVRLEHASRVKAFIDKIHAEQIAFVTLFGNSRKLDFSQFRPRAHYVESPVLQRYFRTLMWLGRIDFRLTQGNEVSNPFSELAGAVLLTQLLHRGEGEWLGLWSKLDGPVSELIGWADSMTPVQFDQLLQTVGKHEMGTVTRKEEIVDLHDRIRDGQLGFQNIQTHHYKSPLGPEQTVMPRSMTFLGQRFAIDSWVLSNVVYDRILNEKGEKVLRRMPGGLDVAFGALGNNAALPTIISRMKDKTGRPFRDGLFYQNELAGVREVVDQQSDATWSSTVYNRWVDALRELSKPMGEAMPSTLRTKAWRMKDLNTQLASWTQLRHATVLYVKQSVTSEGSFCLIPEAYVEPRPAFWRKMKDAAKAMEAFVSGPVFSGEWQTQQIKHYANFAATMAKLEAMALKEVNGEALSVADLDYFQNLVEVTDLGGCGGPDREYSGWYPQLYYPGKNASLSDAVEFYDALVTDVHTNPPFPQIGDPGGILHQGVGRANFMMLALDHPDGRKIAYGGPVLSHYEFDTDGEMIRMTDLEWKEKLYSGEAPEPPVWTKSYLVSGE